MTGTTLTFTKRVQNGTDDFNDPIWDTEEVEIDDCLIAPIIEPATAREQQAMDQAKDQVRIHLPKTTTEDVSGSTVEYDGKVFTVDSDSVVFQPENTPTRWNRYFRAECVNG